MKFLQKFSLLSLAMGVSAGIVLGTALSQGSLGSSVFPDVDSDAYYDSAIGEMVNLGVITGFGDGTFKPDEPLTRGQAAVLLKRLRDEINGIVSSSSRSSSSSSTQSSSSSSNVSNSSSSSSNGSIPSAGLLRFTTTDYPVNEDAGKVTVTLVRAAGNRGRVTVDYYLVPDTATAGSDYTVQEETVVFEAGETSLRFDIPILNDSIQEGNEKFYIRIRNITGGAGTTIPSEATVTIRDDETPTSSSSSSTSSSGPAQGTIGFSAIGYSVSEANGSIIVRVQRKNGSTGTVGVEYSTANGTANGSDYQSVVGTLTFADGETEKEFSINVYDNGGVDGSRTVNLTLSKVTGGAVLGEASSVLTIYDDEVGIFGTGSLKLSDDEYEAYENDGSLTVTVNRVGGSKGEISVKYLSIAGTATNGSDYQDVNNVLVFKNGESAKTFSIKIYDDSITDGAETFTIRIQDPTNGAQLISPNSATVYIY